MRNYFMFMLVSLIVMIFLPVVTLPISFTQHNIAYNYYNSWCIQGIDMDLDGDIDVVASGRTSNNISWFENNGSQAFTQHSLGNIPRPMGLTAEDFDGDFDIDIIAALEEGDRISIYVNDGNMQFSERIIANWDAPHYVFAKDIDQDGDLDFVASACESTIEQVAWFQNDGLGYFTEHTIIQGWDQPGNAHAADMDADGDIDILASASSAGQIAWWENDGNCNFYSMHVVYSTTAHPASAYGVDLDLDGDTDIIGTVCLLNRLMWLENDGNQNFTENVIGDFFNRPHTTVPADLDGDGDLDIAIAAIESNIIAWWENWGGQIYIYNPLSTSFSGATDVYVIDLDQDGDLDILGAGQYSNILKWWENDLDTEVENSGETAFPQFELSPPCPNPFNNSTNITFTVSQECEILLSIYDISGQEIAVLQEGKATAGINTVEFSADKLPSGIYFVRLYTGNEVKVQKMVLLK